MRVLGCFIKLHAQISDEANICSTVLIPAIFRVLYCAWCIVARLGAQYNLPTGYQDSSQAAKSTSIHVLSSAFGTTFIVRAAIQRLRILYIANVVYIQGVS